MGFLDKAQKADGEVYTDCNDGVGINQTNLAKQENSLDVLIA